MKVSIGAKVFDGPWGGGNLFVKNLSKTLKSKGHEVVYNLNDNDLDIILLTDPRKKSESSKFTHKEIKKYKEKQNNDVIVVHRINECDERKQTRGVNKFYIKANKIADHTIFVSQWLKDIYIKSGFSSEDYSVIMAGADLTVFNSDGVIDFNKKEKLKIVTHHWSNNWNKGFNIYEKLDNLLEKLEWSEKFEFTYIGNLPKNFNFKNSKILLPLEGVDLAKELKNHHLYLTASLNEPSGNHHIEAAQCGLPILFINSGGIPEYCEGFGLGFEEENFNDKLKEITKDYDFYKNQMKNYKFNAEKMSCEFINLFELLLSKRK